MKYPVEDELDAVRLALYEQTKGMRASEVTVFMIIFSMYRKKSCMGAPYMV
jgi:hypothetical protein